jgi:Alpha-L-fucosidase
MRRTITCILSVFVTWLAAAPCRAQDEASRRLAQRLAWFQDQKFGLFIHWGPYSQMGCKESWPLSWADRKRANPAITTKEEMLAFRAKYPNRRVQELYPYQDEHTFRMGFHQRS